MPKGLKSKSNKNKTHKVAPTGKKQELPLKIDLEEYGRVTKMCGDCKCMVTLPDNTEVMARIPGKFRKKVWFAVGDIVLISRRDYQQDMIDILYKYSPVEIRQLHKDNEIPDTFLGINTEIVDQGIVMVDDEKVDIDEL